MQIKDELNDIEFLEYSGIKINTVWNSYCYFLSLLLLFIIIFIIYVCVLRSDYLYKKSKNEKKASKRRDSFYFDNETFLNFDNDEL